MKHTYVAHACKCGVYEKYVAHYTLLHINKINMNLTDFYNERC